MTERKPDGLSWQSWIERQIREGQQGGIFDDLDGQGRPIDGLETIHDEFWWVKAKLRDEDINYLPPTIAVRAERADAIDAAMCAETEDEARILIEEVNDRIRYINSHATSGPPSSVVIIDLEMIIDRWRDLHPLHEPADAERSDHAERAEIDGSTPLPRRWWQPWRRRQSLRTAD